jgi:hypothetical protein
MDCDADGPPFWAYAWDQGWRMVDGSPELVGRDTELAAVQGFLGEVRAGPVALALEGVAGIGKTALWQAGMAAAGGVGFRVLGCRPAVAERGLAFAAAGDLLGPVIDEVLGMLPGPQARALEVALLRTAPNGRAGPAGGRGRGPRRRPSSGRLGAAAARRR